MSVDPSVFIAPGAKIFGNVNIQEQASIWYNAVIRGDADSVFIGRKTNIQDCCIIHQDKGFPVHVGENVTVGHGAILHGCAIEDNCIIGMGSIILNGSSIGEGSIIGAGTLVKEGQEIPPGSLAVGSPARIIRKLTEEEKNKITQSAQHYHEMASKLSE
ncbi:gamma carbonic anhydrase family protein [Desulfotomaculum defluvii]